ncbi:MAG TPA: sensor domain-containing diguanylate cyclase [Gammaproteobacteria bacterium]
MNEADDDTRLNRPFASTETPKLAKVHSNDIFYTPIEERFERITRLACRAMDVPVAAITLLSSEKQWFKSVVGWDICELSIANSLCARVASETRVCIVPDAAENPRFLDHPLVVGDPNFRFYASYPLFNESIDLVGTFCIFDYSRRELSEADCDTLTDLGQLAQRELAADRLADGQSELIAKLGATRRETMFDPLTRVWNRRGATALLELSVANARDLGHEIGICLIDLDNFKRVNAQYGHQTGDRVLRKVATTLVNCLRPSDVVARYGGDEFLILLPGADDIQTSTIAERVRRSIADSPVRIRDSALPVSVSAGYGVLDNGADVELESVMSGVEKALRDSKREGRNQVRLAS